MGCPVWSALRSTLTSCAALQEGCSNFQFEIILITLRGATFFGPCTSGLCLLRKNHLAVSCVCFEEVLCGGSPYQSPQSPSRSAVG